MLLSQTNRNKKIMPSAATPHPKELPGEPPRVSMRKREGNEGRESLYGGPDKCTIRL